MKIFTATQEDISASDENDVSPEKLTVLFDPAVIDECNALLAQHPWIQEISTARGVDFKVNASFEGKPRGGLLIVSKAGSLFECYNEYTGTDYECAVPARARNTNKTTL